MNSFHEAIGLEEIEETTLPLHQRAVIARAENHPGFRFRFRQQSFDKFVFAEVSQLHWTRSGKASAVRVTALKSACIIIGTRIEPLHS